MKSANPTHTLFAAFLLLVGIGSTNAALCSVTLFAGTVTTCDCPLGSAPAGSYSPALPAGTYGGATNAAEEIAAANVAFALCTDLLPGYKKALDTTMPTKCVIGDGYCNGLPTAFKTGGTGVFKIRATADDEDSTGYTPITGTYTALTGTGDDAYRLSSSAIPCPANTGGANTPKTASAAGAASTGTTWPWTIDKCKVTPGYYITTPATTATAVADFCPINKVCPTGKHAGSTVAESASSTCIDAAAGNAAGTVGGFICPKWTYGTLGTTLADSIAGVTGEIVCGTGTGPQTGTCSVLNGYYGADSATGVAATACPTGITGGGEATLTLGCTKVAPGYTVLTDIDAQFIAGPVTTLTAGITECAINSFCLGGDASKIVFAGTSASMATYDAVAAHAGNFAAKPCPAGTGNSLTGASAQGANAVSGATACVDLLTGYALVASNADYTAATDAFDELVGKCVVNNYNCGGYAGLFVDYSAATNTLPTGSGLTATSMVILNSGKITADAATAGTGSLIKSACPTNSKNTAVSVSISSCLLDPGYYIDHSALLALAPCPIGKYCPGGDQVGTAGGDYQCPPGSSILSSLSSILNSNINECIVDDGFYIAGVLTTPVPCPAAFICAGGGPVGIAGGSVACPTGSLNAACAGGAASTTVNLTPASQPITVDVAAPTAAASPSVTFTQTPSASSAASTVASMVVVTVAAMVAL